MEAPLISTRIESGPPTVTLGAMSDPLVPGHRYASGAEELWALVVALFGGWEQRVNEAAETAGLSPVSAWALVQLDPKAPVSQKELAARLKCNPSTVVDPADRLEEAGLVARRAHPEDRRVNVLTVTPKGATVRKQLIARLLEPPDAFRRMPAAEQARFRDVMRKTLSAQRAPSKGRGGRRAPG
jgi:MarR family transcriptional regulator, organic hydroperoxide resistance regulator